MGVFFVTLIPPQKCSRRPALSELVYQKPYCDSKCIHICTQLSEMCPSGETLDREGTPHRYDAARCPCAICLAVSTPYVHLTKSHAIEIVD